MKKKQHKYRRYVLGGLGLLLAIFLAWQVLDKPPLSGNWTADTAILSTAEFNGNLVTVKNVRNFTYDADGTMHPAYYDRTYDMDKLVKIWYITQPFGNLGLAAHTFLSFEFADGNYLSITIEIRKPEGKTYNMFAGLIHTFPIIYIAADERDSIFVRANINNGEMYVYPVKVSKPENVQKLLVNMLEKMNDLTVHPAWYNTIFANCTSLIAYHINYISPGRLPGFSWQFFLTAHADKLALDDGLLDTDLSIEEARKKYYVTQRVQEVGYAENYSALIRQFDANYRP